MAGHACMCACLELDLETPDHIQPGVPGCMCIRSLYVYTGYVGKSLIKIKCYILVLLSCGLGKACTRMQV